MKQKILILAVAAGALLQTSCRKLVDEAYTNPNAQVIEPIETLLPNVISNMAVSYTANGTNYGPMYDGIYVGYYVQFWSRYTANYQYDQMGGTIGASDLLGAIWAMHYYGQGQNLNRIVEWGTEQEKWDYVGVAHAIRAWGWLTLTDMYGPAILKQAFDASRLVFEYDTQADIYEEVKRQAQMALENLNRTDGNVSQQNLALGDAYFYNGDTEKWKKFTYSVLARLYNRTTNKSTYNADSVIYYAKLGIDANEDNAAVKFQGLGTSTNSFYGPYRGNIGTLRQTKFIADLESGDNTNFMGTADPRRWYIIRENNNGTFKGIRPTKGNDGLDVNEQPQNLWGNSFTSTSGSNANARYIFKDAAPFPVITASEMKFVLAEAYYRKGDKTSALQAYKEGITLSMENLRDNYAESVPTDHLMNDADITAYVNDPVISPAASADLTLSDIMLQKYISLYGYGAVETWVDLRRYHYTDVEAGTGQQVYTDFEPPAPEDLYANNNGKYVYRARPRYNSEYLYNVDALQKVGGLDLDYHTKEMWFSQP